VAHKHTHKHIGNIHTARDTKKVQSRGRKRDKYKVKKKERKRKWGRDSKNHENM